MFYPQTSRVAIFFLEHLSFFSIIFSSLVFWYINVRENRRGDQEWTIQRHRQHRVEDTERRQTKRKKK